VALPQAATHTLMHSCVKPTNNKPTTDVHCNICYINYNNNNTSIYKVLKALASEALAAGQL